MRVWTAIWTVCRWLSLALQLIGFTGIMFFCLIGLWKLAGRIEGM